MQDVRGRCERTGYAGVSEADTSGHQDVSEIPFIHLAVCVPAQGSVQGCCRDCAARLQDMWLTRQSMRMSA
eukprot:225885-Pelagomonas_calceolata.AAC.1